MDCEITKREVLASISIVAIMMMFGILISGKISDHQMDKNEVYNKAVKIESQDIFEYGMRTDIGNAFVYGDLIAIDPVTYPEIGGEYMYIEKVKERYTMHTRTYTTTDSNGRTQVHTETYWTWDRVGSEDLGCKNISFLGVQFDSSKIGTPVSSYITTIKESSHVRYKYYGVGTTHTGTIFTELKDKTISDNTRFYNNSDIQQTVEHLTSMSKIGVGFFWFMWIILTGFLVYGFYYIDNRWLE